MLCTTEIGHWMSGPTIAVFISNSQHCHSIILITIELIEADIMLNKGHSLYTLQCNELNWGHPTLISQSQVTFTTKESGFGSW